MINKFLISGFISIYTTIWGLEWVSAKIATSITIPFLKLLFRNSHIKRVVIKRTGSVENALKNARNLPLDIIPIDAMLSAEKVYSFSFCILASTLLAIISLVFDLHFMWNIFTYAPLLSLVLFLVPEIITDFIFDLPKEQQKQEAVDFITSHNKKECLRFCFFHLSIFFFISICWGIMVYIILFIMQDKVSSYQAIEIFFNNLLNGLKYLF